MDAQINATPLKLRNSDRWGVRIDLTSQEVPEPGEEVTVTTKSGKTWTSVIEKVFWKNAEVALCTVEEKAESDATYPAERTPDGSGSTDYGAGHDKNERAF